MDAIKELLQQVDTLGLVLHVVEGKLQVTGQPTTQASDFVKTLAMHKEAIIKALTPKSREPLPDSMFVHGVAKFTTVWALSESLKETYTVALGKNDDGFYIVSPVVYTGQPVKDDSQDEAQEPPF